MSYHAFEDAEGNTSGSFEVFYHDHGPGCGCADEYGDGEPVRTGWYWWSCFPGCIPDGELNGPFATEQEAIDDANS